MQNDHENKKDNKYFLNNVLASLPTSLSKTNLILFQTKSVTIKYPMTPKKINPYNHMKK